MKHMKDAKQLYMAGDSKGALEIIESILSISPKNIEALKLKSLILDAWGRFDESLHLLQKVANYSQIDDEDAILNLNSRLDEDRDSLIYSRFTEEGRWYFSFSPVQLFIAVFGLAGCVLFLISSPFYFNKPDAYLFLGLSFFILVLFPWLILFMLHFRGVKKVLIGLDGLSVFHGFSKDSVKWKEIGRAVIEYEPNLNKNYLHLLLYSKDCSHIKFDFNISHKKSDIFARRHFVKNIADYLGGVTYLEKGTELKPIEEGSEEILKQEVSLPDEN